MTKAQPLTSYLVEAYVGDSSIAEEERRARGAAEQLSAEGTPIGYVRSIFVPEDETCFHIFDAPSRDAVSEASRRAALAYVRIVETAGADVEKLE